MDSVAKLAVWLERNGHTASWEQIERKFRVAFPRRGVRKSSVPRLSGLLITSQGAPLYGKRNIGVRK